MRLATIASALAIAVCLAVFGATFWQKTSVSSPAPLPAPAAPADQRAPAATIADVPSLPPVAAISSCVGNSNAVGITRVVEIDTTGGPGFGFEHFKSHDFLREDEVVLTFDDGPWPKNTPAVLAALSAHAVNKDVCKITFCSATSMTIAMPRL